MKKILFFTASYSEGRGGVASYAHDFVDAYSDDYDFVIVAGDNYKEPLNKEKGIFHIPSENFEFDNAKKVMDLIDDQKPDIIINSSFPILSILAPFIPDGIKMISVSHFVNWKLMWIAGFNGVYDDSIISLSRRGSKNIESSFLKGDTSKCKVVYNYIDSIEGNNIDEKKDRKILKLVYPGGCSYGKSAEIMAHALKKLLRTDLDFEFYWTGNGKIPGDKWPLVRTKNVKDVFNSSDPRIKHVGPLERDKNKALLSDCNVFLLPSRGEGCPIALLESIRSGCIVVISDADHGSKDILVDGKFGCIVKQGSAKALYNKMVDIIKYPESYESEYERSRAFFRSHLSYNNWKRRMNKVLESPLSHVPRDVEYSEKSFKKVASKMKSLMRKAWIQDRFGRQLYHFVYFRYLRYFVR